MFARQCQTLPRARYAQLLGILPFHASRFLFTSQNTWMDGSASPKLRQLCGTGNFQASVTAMKRRRSTAKRMLRDANVPIPHRVGIA
jgi:hypothetical protein